MAEPASEKYMALVGMVALLTAGFLLLARVFKLGFLADFLSRTVLVGFLTGVGLQVGIAMLGDMLGVTIQWQSHDRSSPNEQADILSATAHDRRHAGANLSPHTQRAYIERVSRFARYFAKSPAMLGPEEIRTCQIHLANERKLAPSSIQIAIAALRFLYRVTLKKDWAFTEVIPSPKAAAKLPVVLSRDEVRRFLCCLDSVKHRAILTTCYGAGLRVSEAVCLKMTDIHSRRMVIRVAQGKGQKDRYVMLSPKLLDTLRSYWRGGAAEGVALPRQSSRPADHEIRRRLCLREGASARRHRQTHHAAFLAPRLCHSSARHWDRRSYDPALA